MEIRDTKYDGYHVSEDGKVYSSKSGSMRELKTSSDTNGYVRLQLNNKGKKVNVRVHTLVTEAFIGSIPKGMTVNHKDGVKSRNHYTNLEIATYRENNLHAYKMGLKKGVTHKLTDEDVYKILELYNSGVEAKAIGKTFNVSHNYVYQLTRGKRKPHVRNQYSGTMRSNKKLTDRLCAQMIREVLKGADIQETATKYQVKPNYVYEIMRKEKRLNAWKLVGIDTPTIPSSKTSAEVVAQMIVEVQNGLPKADAIKKYGISRSQLFKILRKDFREDAWKLIEGSETIESTPGIGGSE